MEGLTAFLCSSAGAALVAGIFALIQWWMKRRAEKKDREQDKADEAEKQGKQEDEAKAAEWETVKKALCYLMLYIIQERCKEIIAAEEVTPEELRSLHHWHDVYHNGLGGNGDADALMKRAEAVKIITD